MTLGIEAPALSTRPPQVTGTPVVLCVSSVEGRKNHVALTWRPAKSLWSAGTRFELRLIGLCERHETGGQAVGLIEKLRSAGRPPRYEGAVAEAELE